MPESVIQRAFSGGEIAPAYHSRADIVRYATGLRRCRNFIVLRSGGVANRPGLRFVAECKTTSDDVKLMRYVSEVAGESRLIEHGIGYFRFYKNGAPVRVVGADAWDIATEYTPSDIVSHEGVNYHALHLDENVGNEPPDAAFWYPMTGDIYEIPSGFDGLYNWVQSGRVITLTHPDAPPRELRYDESAGFWLWRVEPAIVTGPYLDPPLNLVGVLGTPGPGGLIYSYVVTAEHEDTYEESNPSDPEVMGGTTTAPSATAPNELSWDVVDDAGAYLVYLDQGNGVFGFIGKAITNAFLDIGIAPDFGNTPPIPRVLFASENNYPAIAAYHQQRRLFACTNNEPDAIWASRSGLPKNFGIRRPLQDDDALTFKIAGNNNHPVRHLVPLKTLIALTDGGAWVIGEPRVALTPSNIPIEQETYTGSSEKRPAVVGSTLAYVQTRGTVLRDVRFTQEVEGLAGRDLTLFATHLFDGRSIGAVDYAQVPHSIVWVTTGGGTLLGLTYIPEHDIIGWHRHDSAGGSFDDVCVVPEEDEDGVYCLIAREIDGTTRRYIERLASRTIGEDTFNADVFFVDSGVSYSGEPASTFDGLEHLEGEVVAVVADGAVLFNGDPDSALAVAYTVTDGALTLNGSYTNVHIGLAIRHAEIETLDLDVQGSAIRDAQKKVGSVNVLVDRSSTSFYAGPDSSHLLQARLRPYETAADEASRMVEVNLSSKFDQQGRVFIRQIDPLPLTILAIVPSATLGG